jgi:hypothetical protein
MNLEEVDYFLQHLQPLQQKGCIEEGLRNITAVLDPNRLTRGEIGAVLSNILNYPTIVQDCSIDINADGFSEHLFRITSTGVDLREDAIEYLEEEADIRAARYRRDINSHADSGREGEVVYELVNLLQEISNTSYTVDSTILLSKSEILDIWVSETSNWSVDPDRLNLQFWFEIENFVDWVDRRDLVEYASEMFSPDEMPMLVYHSNNTEIDLNGSEYFPVFALSESPQYLSSQFDSYRTRCLQPEKIPHTSIKHQPSRHPFSLTRRRYRRFSNQLLSTLSLQSFPIEWLYQIHPSPSQLNTVPTRSIETKSISRSSPQA